jgi:DNA methylase
VTAARLVRGFAVQGDVVLDPFAGCGTVLIEANIAGRASLGTDLNPFAVELTREKLRMLAKDEPEALMEAASVVAEYAADRRLTRAGATRRFPPEDVDNFAPHTLLELDSLRAGIFDHAPPSAKWPLLLVLSSLLTKMSQKRGDSSEMQGTTMKRIAAGYPSKVFLRKTAELIDRKQAFEKARTKAPARMILDDATQLLHIKPASVDLVVSSPPYAATYDYVDHHAMRVRWLGLTSGPMVTGELGSRRAYRNLSSNEAMTKWMHELTGFFRALAPKLRGGARVALVIADSATGATALRADEMVPRAAKSMGLRWVATVSQVRPHFHMYTAKVFEKEPRREHVVLLERESPRK